MDLWLTPEVLQSLHAHILNPIPHIRPGMDRAALHRGFGGKVYW